MKREDYIFASTRARIFEKDLLTSQMYLNLIEKETIKETIDSLKDTPYIKYFSEEANYEDSLYLAFIDLYNSVDGLVDDDYVVKLSGLKYLYHNLKVLTKSKLFDVDMDYLLINIGENLNDYKTLINNQGLVIEKNKNIRQLAIEDAFNDYLVNKDSQRIEFIYDSYYFKNLLELAEKIGSEVITEYIKKLIDFSNIDILIRNKRRERKELYQEKTFNIQRVLERRDLKIDYFELAFLDGGNLDKDILIESLNKRYSDIAKTRGIIGTEYEEVFLEIEKNEEGSSLEKLEKKLNSDLFEESKGIVYGPEVIFSYILQKEEEINNLSVILSSKNNNIDNDKVIERIGIDA